MAAPKGTMPPNAGKGRPKGSTNKTTASVKEALRQVYEDLGGHEALAKFARGNPAEFYRLWGRMLPQEVDVTSLGKSLAPAHKEAELEEARRRAEIKIA